MFAFFQALEVIELKKEEILAEGHNISGKFMKDVKTALPFADGAYVACA